MSIHYRPTVAEIDLKAFRANVAALQKKLPSPFDLMAVIKANAYGHGAVMCARTLKGLGVTKLAVATVEEGIELRDAGIRSDIYVLGGCLTPSLRELLDYQLKPVLHFTEEFLRFGAFLKENDRQHPVQVKFDTGMGRLGFLPSQTEEVAAMMRKYSQLQVEGILTHLARADEEESAPTEKQFEIFNRLRAEMISKGAKVPFYHIANSAALIEGKVDSFAMGRPGLMLYGAYPHPRLKDKIELQPVLTLKTAVLNIKSYLEGTPISYGGTFVTKRPSRLAVLPVGYADGYPRLLSNKGEVLIGGRRAPIVGRVCMDLTMVDVTDIPEAKPGDEVILIGSQGPEKITAEDVAAWAQTIAYEILCGISARVPRVYQGM